MARPLQKTAQPDFSKIEPLIDGRLWSWSELARRSSLAVDTVLSLRAGRRRASYQTIRKIADALQVEPGEIVKKGTEA